MIGEAIIQSLSSILNETNGVVAGRCLILDSTENQVKYPTGSNLRTFAGVTNSATANGRGVSLVKEGLCHVTAAGAIAIGDHLYMSGTAGKVAAIPIGVTPSATYWCVGRAESAANADNDIITADIVRVPFQVVT